ncbi:unnamed protein product [Rangifer tarandus platyrhynchus]|uniref:Uncharacterized protein n=2 Tax=Rangifer tarandus platyrhynchus TaxID=3082113 RepID=A0AC60A9P0_RANTA|nr:unnamed protein product [Rangifer tarandus platyrhynchus]
MDGVGWTAMVWAAQIRNVSRSLWLISLQAHPGCHTCPHSVQFSRSVMSDSRNPMDHSTPGLPVHHQLPEFAQTHVHRVGDAIQPSHSLLSPSPTFSLLTRGKY